MTMMAIMFNMKCLDIGFDINADIFKPYDLKSALTTLTSIKIAAFAYHI